MLSAVNSALRVQMVGSRSFGGSAAAAAAAKVWDNHLPNTGVMLPPGSFDGKVALVTGGGTGLVRAPTHCILLFALVTTSCRLLGFLPVSRFLGCVFVGRCVSVDAWATCTH